MKTLGKQHFNEKNQKYIYIYKYIYIVTSFVENAFRSLQCYIIQMSMILTNSFII